MKWTLLVLALALPVAGFNVPQTRQEFVKVVAAGERGTEKQTFVVERGFDQVYEVLQERSTACLDVTVKRTAYVGYTEHSSSDYNPTLRKAGAGKAEFALQVVHRPRAIGENAPPGGMYVMAADIRSLGKGRTELVVYLPTMGYKRVARSLKEWAAGENTDCPKLR